MNQFTRGKFLALSYEQKHKKCALLLKDIFNSFNNEPLSSSAKDNYNQLVEWMGLNKLNIWTKESISDAYHEHLSHSKTFIKEHDYLITQFDKDSAEPLWPIAIYLDNLRSAHNIGSILRTVEAFSLGKIYFSEKTAFTDHPQVQKTSMRSYSYVEAKKISSFADLPKPLIALETAENSISLYDFLFPPSFTLIVGNEEYGCSKSVLSEINFLIKIPMRGRKNSLNVANAFSIAAYEISKQRRLR